MPQSPLGVPPALSPPADGAAENPPEDLRWWLVHNPHNVELRKKYLASRTPGQQELDRLSVSLLAWRLLLVGLPFAVFIGLFCGAFTYYLSIGPILMALNWPRSAR